MNLTLRRARPKCSAELQAALRLVTAFNEYDLELARALVAARWTIAQAAGLLGISREAARQRLSSFLGHLSTALPSFSITIRRGPKAREVSYDQYQMAGLLGIEDHRGDD